MIEKCGNCVHFQLCDEARPNGFCHSNKLQYRNAYKPLVGEPTDCLFYFDGDGFNSEPLVGPDFGCIHFKAKTNEKKIASN